MAAYFQYSRPAGELSGAALATSRDHPGASLTEKLMASRAEFAL